MKKNGFTLSELLIVVATILIVAAVVIPDWNNRNNRTYFKTYFGIEVQNSWQEGKEAKAIVQQLVSKRLQELDSAAKEACKVPVFSEPATDPRAVSNRLAVLNEMRTKCEQAKSDYRKASGAAKTFKFSTGNEDGK